MNDDELKLYVQMQDPWAPDNTTFVEKYRGFDTEQLKRACKIAKELRRQEQDMWLPDMIARGEYELLGSPDFNHNPTLFGGASSRRMQPGPDGMRVFTFGHEKYPFVQMRAREIGWLEATSRGIDMSGEY